MTKNSEICISKSGLEQRSARGVHSPEVGGSNPSPATIQITEYRLQITEYRVQITDNRLQSTDYNLFLTLNSQLQTLNSQL